MGFGNDRVFSRLRALFSSCHKRMLFSRFYVENREGKRKFSMRKPNIMTKMRVALKKEMIKRKLNSVQEGLNNRSFRLSGAWWFFAYWRRFDCTLLRNSCHGQWGRAKWPTFRHRGLVFILISFITFCCLFNIHPSFHT